MRTENKHADNLNAARGNDQKPSQQESAPQKKMSQRSNLWPLAFATAIACYLIGLIPIVGYVIVFPFRALLFVFILKQKAKNGNLASYLMMFGSLMPIVSMAPLDIASVYKTYLQSKKNA